MSRKAFLISLVLIGNHCFVLAIPENNSPQKSSESETNKSGLENLPQILRKSIQDNATTLQQKQIADKEIENILFGENSNIQKCLNITLTRKRQQAKQNATTQMKPRWTVVVLEESKLQNLTFNVQQCTGSLINYKVVLTAAHCMFNKTLSHLKVRAGEGERKSGQNITAFQERKIESVVLKNYDPEKPKNDIALIFLLDAFQPSPHIRQTCLPPPVALDVNYAQCSVSGWQRSTKSGAIMVGENSLKELSMTLLPHDRCEKVLQMTALRNNFTLRNDNICASAKSTKLMLIGNGGAPLVCPLCGVARRTVQIGVMSWGFNDPPLPEVFTATSSFYRWIKKEFNKRKIELSNCGIKGKKKRDPAGT